MIEMGGIHGIILGQEKQNLIYDSQGFLISELLPGSYQKGIHFYRCSLKAGYSHCPELYKDKIVLLLFGFGKGYITDERNAYHIEEVVFMRRILTMFPILYMQLMIWSL